MSNFESSVKVIPYSQERVYNKLSDLSNLEAVKDRLPKDKVQDLSFDSDTLSFSVSPIGKLTLQIVERDPCKCIYGKYFQVYLPFHKITILLHSSPLQNTMTRYDKKYSS